MADLLEQLITALADRYAIEREIKIGAHLAHPHILPVHHPGEVEIDP